MQSDSFQKVDMLNSSWLFSVAHATLADDLQQSAKSITLRNLVKPLLCRAATILLGAIQRFLAHKNDALDYHEFRPKFDRIWQLVRQQVSALCRRTSLVDQPVAASPRWDSSWGSGADQAANTQSLEDTRMLAESGVMIERPASRQRVVLVPTGKAQLIVATHWLHRALRRCRRHDNG